MTESLPMPISTLSKAQRTSVMNLVRRASRSEILPRFRALESADIDHKTSKQDLVTEADRAAERMIARGLIAMFPNALIIGEEAVAENPAILDGIPDAELSFTIDPVDGTWNYAHGLSIFGVIISATRFGVPFFGLLYDPLMDDFIVGQDGKGAEMIMPRRAPRRLSVSKGGNIEDLQGYIPLYNLPEDKREQVAVAMPKFERANSLRCTAHEFRMVAQGHADFILAGKLTPWDHAAGALICKCAGGHVAMLDGSEYRAQNRTGQLLCASDAATWGRIRDTLDFLIDTPDTPDTPKSA